MICLLAKHTIPKQMRKVEKKKAVKTEKAKWKIEAIQTRLRMIS